MQETDTIPQATITQPMDEAELLSLPLICAWAGDRAVVAQYVYGPFGELVRASGPLARAFNFLFSTKYFDWETGLSYYGHRYYNPTTGRWLSRDPIGEFGGLNLYIFTQNDLIGKNDFLGLLTPKEFWEKWADEQRNDWFNNFREDYYAIIEKYSRAFCVPKALLAAIVANEQIDYSRMEALGERFGIGSSVGLAQITIETAVKNNLFPNIKLVHFQDYYRRDGEGGQVLVTAQEQYYSAIRHALQQDDSNIQAAARLMSRYLGILCKRSKTASMSVSFQQITLGCKIEDFCCNRDCANINSKRIPSCLISGMAAMWNNGPKIIDIKNIPKDSPNAWEHAEWAGKLYGIFD